LVISGLLIAGMKVKSRNLKKERPMTSIRETRIKDYLDMLDLGNELYESDKRMVTRKTTTTTKDASGRVVITYQQEVIEFT